MHQCSSRWLLTLLLLCSVGCTTYAKRMSQIRSAYYDNGVASAEVLLTQAMKKDRLNADVLKLDHALLQLASGNAKAAETSLREVRDKFESLEGHSMATNTLAYLTDDTHRAYAGEDYEKVFIRAFLAISNLMHDGTDAEAYCLQMMDKQQQIIEAAVNQKNGENPKGNYHKVAFAPFLRGILREATHHSYDDAARSFATVAAWQPDYAAVAFDIQRAQHGQHSQRGNGVLYVFACVGRGPYKEAVSEVPSSTSLLIAGEILSAVGNQTLPPNVAAIQVPRVVAAVNEIQNVQVQIDSHIVGHTATVTNVTQLAIQQYEAIYPQVIARAVARRCIKKGVIYGTKEMSNTQRSSLPSVALDLAGVVWEATESPDTRCWSLLPEKIQVLRVELPAGEHALTLRSTIPSGVVLRAAGATNFRIADGSNTYVLANFPGINMVGEILVSQHDNE